MSSYPSFTRDFVLFDLACVEGWAWVAWATENRPWASVERRSDGYVGQALERLKKTRRGAPHP